MKAECDEARQMAAEARLTKGRVNDAVNPETRLGDALWNESKLDKSPDAKLRAQVRAAQGKPEEIAVGVPTEKAAPQVSAAAVDIDKAKLLQRRIFG